jgi:hypothetical protein
MGEALKKIKPSEWIMIAGCLISVGIFYNRTDNIEKNQYTLDIKIDELVHQVDIKDEKDRQYAYNQSYANRQKIEQMAQENRRWREEFIQVKVELKNFGREQEKQTKLLEALINKRER